MIFSTHPLSPAMGGGAEGVPGEDLVALGTASCEVQRRSLFVSVGFQMLGSQTFSMLPPPTLSPSFSSPSLSSSCSSSPQASSSSAGHHQMYDEHNSSHNYLNQCALSDFAMDSWYYPNYEYTPASQSLPNISSFYLPRELSSFPSSSNSSVLNDLTPVQPSEPENQTRANSSPNSSSNSNGDSCPNGGNANGNSVVLHTANNVGNSRTNEHIANGNSNSIRNDSVAKTENSNAINNNSKNSQNQNGPSKKKKTR